MSVINPDQLFDNNYMMDNDFMDLKLNDEISPKKAPSSTLDTTTITYHENDSDVSVEDESEDFSFKIRHHVSKQTKSSVIKSA